MKSKIFLLSLAFITILNAENIKSIEFVNVTKISKQILNEILDLKVNDKLDEKKINNAVVNFYKQGYFEDIQVVNKNGNLKLIFKERPSIANIDIKGYKTRKLDVEELKSHLKLKKGSIYTEEKINEVKKRLLAMLENEGVINSVIEVEVEKINEQSLSVVFNVNKGEPIIINKAKYHGSKELNQSDFNKVTANKEIEFAPWWFGQNDGKVNIEQLQYDGRRINDLYYEKGFLDAEVKEPFLNIDFASNQAKLDIFINEGKKYKVNDIKLYLDESILSSDNIYPKLKSKIGKTFNIKLLREDQEYIRTQFADLGYAYVQVNFDLKKDEKEKLVDISFSVIPAKKVYINDVKISGNVRTLDRVIRRNVFLAPGDLYNLTDFKYSTNKLKRTGFFSDVLIEEKRVSEDKIDIFVKVTEAPTGSLMIGGGYGSYDKLMLSGSIQDSNIFGSGLSLGLSADLSSHSDKFQISLNNPAIRDSDYNGEIEIHSTNYEILRTKYNSNIGSKGFSAGLGKEFFRNVYFGATYRYDQITERYYYNESAKNELLSSGKEIFENQNYLSSSVTPYISFDNTNDYYFPTEGYRLYTSLEYAGLGGDSKYTRSTSSARYFYSLEDLFDLDYIIRIKTQVRMLFDNGQINQGDSLYLGGVRTLRGYEAYAFPRNVTGEKVKPYKNLWSNSAELSFPLLPSARMRWGVFYDYGMIGQNKFDDIIRSGTGFLLEWVSPMGPLQLIFAKPLGEQPGDDTSNFEISFGASF